MEQKQVPAAVTEKAVETVTKLEAAPGKFGPSVLSGVQGKMRHVPKQCFVNGVAVLGQVYLTDAEWSSIASILSRRVEHDQKLRGPQVYDEIQVATLKG